MSNRENYWERRIRRRRVLGGVATAGIGAASLALVGCGDDDDDETPTSAATSSGSPAASASPAGSPTTAPTPAVQKQSGGIARFTSANNTYDTFDADRTRFGPMAGLLGYTNHGVVCWDNYAQSKISGYFAESYEQPTRRTSSSRSAKD